MSSPSVPRYVRRVRLRVLPVVRSVPTMNTTNATRRVAANIRAELARQGRTISWLAEAVGVGRTTLGRRLAVNSARTMSVDDVSAIADALRVDMLSLFESNDSDAVAS